MSQAVSLILSLQLAAHALVGCCLHHAHTWVLDDCAALAAQQREGETKSSCGHAHRSGTRGHAQGTASSEPQSLAGPSCSHGGAAGHQHGPGQNSSCEAQRCVLGMVSPRTVDIDLLSAAGICCVFAALADGDPAGVRQLETICHLCGTPAALPVRTHLLLSVLLR